MKILHTADWHIGKQLHKVDLSDDLELFFDWLIDTIAKEDIDLLLVSGDVFDQANPSQASLKQYYGFLKRMLAIDCKIILTGGNHDSASVLNAPKEILEFLNIDVIGGAPEDINDLFIKYTKKDEQVVIAAVPFLRDKDIRNAAAGESYSDKIEQIREGITSYFSNVNSHYMQHYPGLCFIVMGHLYVQGSTLSESERDIQIGNQAGVEAEMFGEIPHYVALGHIHKPQVISKAANIHYCGSPIPLSFSEREDCKQVNILTLENNRLKNLEILPIPNFRNLVTFEGNLEEVMDKINNYSSTSILKSLAEVVVNEEEESLAKKMVFEDFINSRPNPDIEIVKTRLNFKNRIQGATDVFSTETDVTDVTPMEMFEKRLELETDLEDKEELILAFQEILEELKL